MSATPEVAVVAQGPLARMKEMLRVLERAGFDAQIVTPPDAKPNA